MIGRPVLNMNAFTKHVDGEALQHRFTAPNGRSAVQRYGVLIVGPDHFKIVNETFGYSVGDEVLLRIGDRIRSALRKEDQLIRLPGDEFAVLLQNISAPEELSTTTTRIKDLLERTYMLQGHLVNIASSMGAAVANDAEVQPETLLQQAAIALKSAKATAPGSLQLFEKSMEDRIALRYSLTLELKRALPLRQLEVHYQPQVDMHSEELTGFEALLRWRHPTLGWISPAEFIPLAEQLGLISQIGDWVLRTACKLAAVLPENIVIAVNASPLQFVNGSFLSSVERALSAVGLPARRLEVEITEGVLLKDERKVISTLNDLRSMGVRLAMDDFGTGYSCLGRLAELPFDTIKIDRSLVGGSAKQRAIVRAITTLGEGLGMTTLAEGIETRDQFAKAQSDGCMFGQGYLFGKAISPDRIGQVLSRFSRADHLKLKRGA